MPVWAGVSSSHQTTLTVFPFLFRYYKHDIKSNQEFLIHYLMDLFL
jgi:hypothetical protein